MKKEKEKARRNRTERVFDWCGGRARAPTALMYYLIEQLLTRRFAVVFRVVSDGAKVDHSECDWTFARFVNPERVRGSVLFAPPDDLRFDAEASTAHNGR